MLRFANLTSDTTQACENDTLILSITQTCHVKPRANIFVVKQSIIGNTLVQKTKKMSAT
jgi:hypothetical protein